MGLHTRERILSVYLQNALKHSARNLTISQPPRVWRLVGDALVGSLLLGANGFISIPNARANFIYNLTLKCILWMERGTNERIVYRIYNILYTAS